MKSATYFAEITIQKAEKFLFERGKLESTCLPTCSAWCQLRNFPREFTEKCFAVFDQSSGTIISQGIGRSYFSGNLLL